jgi:CRP/FNR family cyclic AMP-dependent transcriptional regulator
MQTIDELLPDYAFFAGLDSETITLLAGCASNIHLRPGQFLFHEGEPANHFYLLRHGRVAIEIHQPAVGPVVLDTVDDGDVVGWSWAVPPYRWAFDARAFQETSAVAFDAVCLRAKCEANPRLGYEFLQRVTQVMNRRLQSARIRLLDMYGSRS